MESLTAILRLAMAALALATPAAVTQQPPQPCALADDEGRWTVAALDTWDAVRTRDLRLPDSTRPWMVLYDARCAWHLAADETALAALRGEAAETVANLETRSGVFAARGFAHAGTIALPGGGGVPARVASFAGSWGERKRPFLAMALPAIWRAEERHRHDPRLDLLTRAVLVHEMTHTRQGLSLGGRIDAIAAARHLGDDFDDDIIQDRFGERPGFRAAYARERDLLYAAAHAAEPEARRRLAVQALAAWRARRAQFFSGPQAFYAELEDLFLQLEGAAQWAAYRATLAELGEPAAAEAFMRRGGRKWSQDEGLALFLLFETAVPDWRARVFSAAPPSLDALLADAAAR